MSELAEASGVSAGTIKHYLREGLLPEPVRTSRNMAYYPPEFVERVRLIKRLQEQRFMPLKVIKRMLRDDPDRTRALIELEDRVLETAMAGEEKRISGAELHRRYDIPREVIGFTVYDTLRYKSALEGLVKEEVEILMQRLAGEMDADRAVELVESGAEPLQDLISALHSKLLVAELRRQRELRADSA
jgi:DNA-binding transcriptional MerR regulator